MMMVCVAGEGISHASHNMLIAAQNGETEKVIDYITINGVPMTTKNNYGVSAIIFAANNGHLDLLEALVDIGADIEDRSNNWRTPLLWSSFWGHYECVEYLVDVGANISAFDTEGMTALQLATKNGNAKVVQFLLDSGADPLARNAFNGTALTIARIQNNTLLLSILEPYYPPDPETNPYLIMLQIIRREAVILSVVFVAEVERIYTNVVVNLEIFRNDMNDVYIPWLRKQYDELDFQHIQDTYIPLLNEQVEKAKAYSIDGIQWLQMRYEELTAQSSSTAAESPAAAVPVTSVELTNARGEECSATNSGECSAIGSEVLHANDRNGMDREDVSSPGRGQEHPVDENEEEGEEEEEEEQPQAHEPEEVISLHSQSGYEAGRSEEL